MQQRRTQVLVIGAGPSGMVSANYLNNHGIKVLVVEKATFPRFSIGESLIPRCMDNFAEAGLLDCLKSKGYQEKTGARFVRPTKDGYDEGDFDFSKKHGDGWDWTWQVPRADFDLTLATEVQKNGVEILFNTEVISVEFNEGKSKTIITNAEGSKTQIEADYIIDSSGFGRVLARQLGLEAAPKISNHSSIFTHVKDIRRPDTFLGTRITFEVVEREVWFWYIPFSNVDTSIGFVGKNDWFEQFDEHPTERLKAMMETSEFYKKQFDDLPYLFEPKQVQNISKNVTKLYGEGFVLTGNSAEFLDPVFSSGVSFATESGLLAAKLILKELQNEDVNWQVDYVDYIKRGVNVFSTYVKEWYTGNLQEIFFHKNPNHEIKRQICAVLAGYVWDETNTFVKRHDKAVLNLAKLIEMEKTKY